MLRKLIIFLVLLNLMILSSCSNQDELELNYSFKSAINVNCGINDFDQINFQSNNLDLGFHKGNVWIKLDITNVEKYNSYIVIMNDLLNHNYRFYKLDTLSNELKPVSFVKDLTRQDHRTFNYSNPNFKIDLSPNEQATFIIALTNDGREINVTPQLITLKNHTSFINGNMIWSIFFLSMIVFLLFLNIYLWIIHRQKIYFYYIFYMLATFFMFIGLEGHLYKLHVKYINIDHLIFLSVRIWIISLIIYTSTFLEIKKVAPRYYKFIKKLLIIIIGGTTIYQITFFHSSISHLHYFENILSFFWLLIIFVTIFISAKTRKLELKYYIIPLFCFLIFTTIGLIDGYFQILPGSPFIYIKIGTIIEFTGFTYFMTLLIKRKLERTENLENELLDLTQQLESSLDNLTSHKPIEKTDLLNIFKLLESTLSKDGEWSEFKAKFEELSPYFLVNLNQKHPNLSKSEIRLLILIRIGFTQKEIADILNIVPDSVKKAKHRVRKKLDLPSFTNLTDYLSQIS